MTIKHLVIPGGGPTGIKALGALRHLQENGFWKMDDIETIYGTSAGAFIAVFLALKFDWDTITDYIVKRPWHDACKRDLHQIFDAYSKKGLFDGRIIEMLFKPCLDARSLPLTITLEEFHQYSNVEIHMFTLEVNAFEIIDISHLTHPQLKLLDAIHMTSALPGIIAPICIEGKCYADGGVLCNYPVTFCKARVTNIDEIFGLRNDYGLEQKCVIDESTMVDYMDTLLTKLIYSISSTATYAPSSIPNELIYEAELMNFGKMNEALSSMKIRAELLQSGKDAAIKYLKYEI